MLTISKLNNHRRFDRVNKVYYIYMNETNKLLLLHF